MAEGNGRFTKADRTNFLMVARSSVGECVPLFELARRRKLIDVPTHAELMAKLEETSKMLSFVFFTYCQARGLTALASVRPLR